MTNKNDKLGFLVKMLYQIQYRLIDVHVKIDNLLKSVWLVKVTGLSNIQLLKVKCFSKSSFKHLLEIILINYVECNCWYWYCPVTVQLPAA